MFCYLFHLWQAVVKADLLLWNIQPCLLGCYTDNLCLETLQLWVMVFSYWITRVCETKQTSTVEVWLTCFESPKSFVCLKIVFRIGKCFRPDVLDHVSFNRPPAHNLFNPLFTSSCMSPARADVSFHKFRRPPTQGGFRLSDRHLTTIRGINALCGITRAFLFVSAHTFWEAKLAEVVETDGCVHDRQTTSYYILENTI